MRKKTGAIAAAALLAGSSAAWAGSNLIRHEGAPKDPRPSVRIPQGTDAPVAHARGATPSLYASGVQLGTLASARLGKAVPALRQALGQDALLTFAADGHVTRAYGPGAAPAVAGEPFASALAFLAAHHAALGLPEAPSEDAVVSSLVDDAGAHHIALEQRAFDGTPLYGAIVTIHVDAGGRLLAVQSEAVPAPLFSTPLRLVSEAGAISRAEGLLAKWKLERGPAVSTRRVYVRPEGDPTHRLAWQVDLGADRALIDAASGDVLLSVDRRQYENAPGNVFDPNPGTINTGGEFSSDSNTQFVNRTLTDLAPVFDHDSNAATEPVGFLRGALVNVQDLQNFQAIRSPSDDTFNYLVSSGGPEVDQTCVYFYVTETIKKFRDSIAGGSFGALGQFLPMKVLVDIETENNAFFDPADRSLQFGNGNPLLGIFHIQRDFDVGAHEFGHFIEATYAPDLTPVLNSPRRAMGEGFGDFTAVLVNNAQAARGGAAGASKIGDSTIPVGGGASPTGATRLREINPTSIKRVPQDLRREEHDDGEIIAGALWTLTEVMDARVGAVQDGTPDGTSIDQAYRVLFAGLAFLPQANAQFADLVDALVLGDNQRTGGVNVTDIRSAFSTHGITGGNTAPSQPSGGVLAPREIVLGIPMDLDVGAGVTARFFVATPASTSELQVDVTTVSGSGDAELYAAPNNYTAATSIIKSIQNGASAGTQQVRITTGDATGKDTAGTTITQPKPDITDDGFFLIDVVNQASATVRYRVHARDTTATQPPDLGTFSGATINSSGTISGAAPNRPAFFYFDVLQASVDAGLIAQVEAVRTSGDLVPTTWLFDPDLNVLASDVDGVDAAGNTTGTSRIQGQPLPRAGRYVLAVVGFTPESQPATTSGNFSLALRTGTLPGITIGGNGSGGFTTQTGSISDGQDVLYNITLPSGTNRVRFFLSALSATNTAGDIDLYVKSAATASDQADFVSDAFGTANEVIDVSTRTSPSINGSRVYFVIVRGYDVRSPIVGQTQGYQLETRLNEPQGGGGGGGGCAISAGTGVSTLAGAWLPSALALLGLAASRRRKSARRTA